MKNNKTKLQLIKQNLLKYSQRLTDKQKLNFYNDYINYKTNSNKKIMLKHNLTFSEVNILYNILIKEDIIKNLKETK